MNGNSLNKKDNSSKSLNSDGSSGNNSQLNNSQNNFFGQILFGLFILIGGLAYLFNLPDGTLFIIAGSLMLINCVWQITSNSLSLDWLILLIGFLCLSKGISTLFNYEIPFIPLFFCLLGIFVISKAWKARGA